MLKCYAMGHCKKRYFFRLFLFLFYDNFVLMYGFNQIEITYIKQYTYKYLSSKKCSLLNDKILLCWIEKELNLFHRILIN